MKKSYLFLFSFLLISTLLASQNWVPITSEVPQSATVELISSDIESTTVHIKVPGYEMVPVITPNGTEYIIQLPKAVSLNEEAAPDLYKLAVSAIIPDDAEMKLLILSSEYTDFFNIDVAPSKGHFLRSVDPNTIPYIYGPAYATNEFFPSAIAELQDPYIFRDFRGQAITIQPFQYNPVEKVLRVYHNILVKIEKSGSGTINVFNRSTPVESVNSEFNALYQEHFINYEQNRYPILAEEGRLLIIAHGPYMNDMQPFIDWKKTIGRHTEIVNVANIGTTSDAIKNYVLNYYNTHGLTHLLLIGDHQHVPARNLGGNNGYGDSWYGQLVGSDSFNEVFVGRFSAETTAHVQTQVQRMIEYERDLNTASTWLNVGMGIARNEGTGNGHNGGENDYVHMDYIRDSLLNYTYAQVHKAYDGNVPGVPNTSASQMSQIINDGVSIINFCNHGSQTGWSVGNFSISNVNALTNVGKLPFIWSVACDNGNFTSGLCFAEAWLRATHNSTGEPTGAISTMMSWISQPWQPPMTGQDEMVTILVEKRDHIKRTMGGLSINGSMRMIDLHGSEGIRTHNSWILFGDPTLLVRTAIPQNMIVSHSDAALIGWNEYVVNCNTEGAYVALTIDNEIVGTGYVLGGAAAVQLYEPLSVPGMLKIAITAFNKVAYIQEIEIIPAEGPYLMFSSNVINDAEGNNNGLAEYGEIIHLGVTIQNMGLDDDTGVVATLTSTSPYVTILENTQYFGDINASSTAFVADAFTFQVADNVPDNTLASFTLQMQGSLDSYSSNFNITLHAPVLMPGGYVISDHLGNNNGVVEPGETVYLFLETNNTGTGYANEVLATLELNNEYITLLNDEAYIHYVPGNDKRYGVFGLSVSPNTPENTNINFTYTATAGNYHAQKSFTMKIGAIVEDFETGDFSAFEWAFDGNKDWIVQSDVVYEGAFSARSGVITHNQSTEMKLTHNVASPSSISFYRKVSSEAGYDKLEFFIDNIKYGEWSGGRDWEQVFYNVSPGLRTFRWVYSKDGSASSGSDCAWIDYIQFPPYSATVVYAGEDGIICGNDRFIPNGFANNQTNIVWTTSGTGYFDNPNVENPVYNPSESDVANGSVVLTATVHGFNTMVDNIVLYFAEPAMVYAGQDAMVCENDSYQLLQASAENYTEILWSTSGSGTFSDPTIINPVYFPSVQDIAAGQVDLTLSGNNEAGCEDQTDIMTLSFVSGAQAFAGNNAQVCAGEDILLNASADNYNSLLWTSNGNGQFNDPTALNPVYVPGSQDIANGQVTLTLTATGLGTCNDAVSQVTVAINPLPTVAFSSSVTICEGEQAELIITLTGTAPWIVTIDGEDPITINQSPFSYYATPGQTSSYLLTSVSDANLCSIATEEMAIVIVENAPVAPGMPDGPENVDYAYDNSSVYTVNEVSSAMGYVWNISPAHAGTINPQGNQAEVLWASNFQGEIEISATAYNDCGMSAVSEIKHVELKNTIGVPSLESRISLNLYPNPNKGLFTIEFATQGQFSASMVIFDLLGKVVYEEPSLIFNSHLSKSIDVSYLDSGIYFLSVRNSDGVIHRRIIVQ